MMIYYYMSRLRCVVYLVSCFISMSLYFFFFFKQKTAYEMRISDWNSDVCSSDLDLGLLGVGFPEHAGGGGAGQREVVTIIEALHEAGAEIGRASCRERVCQYV